MDSSQLNLRSQLFEGIGCGCRLVESKNKEETYLQGMSFYAASMFQAQQLALLFTTTSAAMGVNLGNFPSTLKFQFGLLTPSIALWFVHNQALRAREKDPRFEKVYSVTYFVLNQVGNLYQIGSLISSVALIRLGQRVRGGLMTAMLIYGWAVRRRWVPQKIRSATALPMAIVGNVYVLFARNLPILMQVAACLELISIIGLRMKRNEHFEKREHQPVSLAQQPIEELVNIDDDWIDFVFSPDRVKINDQHYQGQIFSIPELPDVNWGEKLTEVIAMFRAYDWNKAPYADLLQNALKSDERWKKMPLEEKTDPVMYVQHGLEQYIVGVGDKTIQNGELTDYKRIQNMTKHILKRLPEIDEKSRASMLLRIGISANNCGPSYLDYIEPIFNELMDNPRELNLQGQILRVLKNARGQLFDSILHQSLLTQLFLFLRDPFVSLNNPHKYNKVLDVAGIELGLPLAEAAHLEGTSASVFDQIAIGYAREIFKEKYREQLVQIIREGLKNGEIDRDAVDKWRAEHKISTDFAWSLDDDDYSAHFIDTLLINMGILQRIKR